MSEVNTIGLIVAAMIATTFVDVWSANKFSKWATLVATGVASGIPLSNEDRRTILWGPIPALGSTLGALTVVNALAMYHLAGIVEHSNTRFIAYAATAFFGASAVGWLGSTVNVVIYCQGAIRRSTRN